MYKCSTSLSRIFSALLTKKNEGLKYIDHHLCKVIHEAPRIDSRSSVSIHEATYQKAPDRQCFIYRPVDDSTGKVGVGGVSTIGVLVLVRLDKSNFVSSVFVRADLPRVDSIFASRHKTVSYLPRCVVSFLSSLVARLSRIAMMKHKARTTTASSIRLLLVLRASSCPR
jgi:hypothetical protein